MKTTKAHNTNATANNKKYYEVMTFDFKGNKVRAIPLSEGLPELFIASDICKILGYSHVTRTLRRLEVNNYDKLPIITAIGTVQEVNVIDTSEVGWLIDNSTTTDAKELEDYIMGTGKMQGLVSKLRGIKTSKTPTWTHLHFEINPEIGVYTFMAVEGDDGGDWGIGWDGMPDGLRKYIFTETAKFIKRMQDDIENYDTSESNREGEEEENITPFRKAMYEKFPILGDTSAKEEMGSKERLVKSFLEYLTGHIETTSNLQRRVEALEGIMISDSETASGVCL